MHATSAGVKSKRKRMSWTTDDFDTAKIMRVRSPPLNRTSTYPPDLIPDQSDEDQNMDLDEDAVAESSDAGAAIRFGASGSGGFGFGPGMQEDLDEEEEVEMEDGMGAVRAQSRTTFYPSLTLHPNPHHFSQKPPGPWTAQSFSTSLKPPSSAKGLLQPTVQTPAWNANEVEKARTVHGSQCKSIPKLVLSDYPDPVTGNRSMWTVCGDCGACEMAE
ncbi:hypothetical protein P7C73_g1053, partial [Tremellales sp. Uapishka_1]